MDAPFRRAFDAALNPLAARNALGIEDGGSGTGGAPTDAQYIVAADDPALTNDRVLTNTATVTWDASTAGQIKANATGFGNVSNSGTPVAGQVAEWVDATHIAGVSTYAKLASPVFTGPVTTPGWTLNLSANLSTLTALGTSGSIIYISGSTTAADQTITFRNKATAPVAQISDNTSNSGLTSANYPLLKNNVAASPAIVTVGGSSANRSLQLVPVGTGTVQAPTMAAGDNSTAIASTAFVTAAVTAAGGASFRTILVTTKTSGSGNHALNANCVAWEAWWVGAGGGGGGSGSGGAVTGGGNGGDTSFNGVTAQGGRGGGSGPSNGIGGTGGSGGAGTATFRSVGGEGAVTAGAGSAAANAAGGHGGGSFFGGGGGSALGAAGRSGQAWGSGGGGGSAPAAVAYGGGGGGAGELCYLYNGAATGGASIAYAVGAVGSSGVAGTSGFAGGQGAPGFLVIKEYLK